MDEFKNLSESAPQKHSAQKRRYSQYLFGPGVLILLVFIPILSGGIFLWFTTPDVSWLRKTNPQETAMMRYREEQQHRMGQPMRRTWQWVRLSRISPYLIQSVIIAEDSEFFQHKGFNWESIWQALMINIRNKRVVRGGSSITQQLAKNLFLGPSSDLIRKIREALITYKLEKELTQERILELYLNVIEWGPGIYGAEAAAQVYFNKSAAELSLSEAISLASVLPNPYLFSPLDNTNQYVQQKHENIAMGLLRRGWISRATYIRVLQELYNLHASEIIAPKVVSPPKVSSKLLNPDYWVSKLSEPDKVIMTESEIRYFNERALVMSGGIDILGFPDFLPRKEVTEKILEVAGLSSFPQIRHDRINDLNKDSYYNLLDNLNLGVMPDEAQIRYDRNNNPLTEHFYYNLLDNLNLGAIPDKVQIRYALVIKRTDVLAWPVDKLIMSKPYDYEFNVLQQSAVYLGTPVAVFHVSRDGRWAFIRTPYFDGWVRIKDLAWTTREEAVAYPGSRFLVVTAPSVRTALGVDLPMGDRIPVVRASPKGYEVKIPNRGGNGKLVLSDDFLNSDGVREDFLPYTKRNIITQAFKLLGGPYSWGGGKFGWDCSLFIQDVFSVFGIKLPRNSSWQAEVSKEIAIFNTDTPAEDKLGTVRLWEPAVTLLELPGHIMLYLGEDGGKPYAIHAIWGVTDKDNNVIKVNKVVVTDLELGQGGEEKSLLERITDVRGVYLDSSDFQGLFKDFVKWLFSHPIRVMSGFAFIILVMLGLAFIILVMRLLEERKGRKRETGVMP